MSRTALVDGPSAVEALGIIGLTAESLARFPGDDSSAAFTHREWPLRFEAVEQERPIRWLSAIHRIRNPASSTPIRPASMAQRLLQ